MAKLYFKSIVFLIILFFFIYKLDKYFVEDDPIYYRYNTFYEIENYTLDVLFIGDSHTANGINTSIISSKCKLDSYGIGVRGTNLFHAYFRLKEALQYQKPKLVVIENYTFLNTMADTTFIDSKGMLIAKNKKDIFAKRLSKNKIEEENLVFQKNKIYNLFNVFRAHENWSDLKSQSKIIYRNNSTLYTRDHYRSFSLKTKKQVKDIIEYNPKSKIGISTDQEMIIKEIIKLSNEHNFELLFLTLPYYSEFYKKIENQVDEVNMKLTAILEGNSNVRLLDLNKNLEVFSRTYFQNETGKENNHLNYKGGIKASYMIANYINSNYDFNCNKVSTKILESYLYNEEIIDSLIDNPYKIKFNLERINNKKDNIIQIQKENSTIDIYGWAFLENQNTKGNKIYLGLKKDEDFIFMVHTESKRRKDVTDFFNKKEGLYDNSGFELKFNSDLLETGNYTIYLVIINDNLEISATNTGKKIQIN